MFIPWYITPIYPAAIWLLVICFLIVMPIIVFKIASKTIVAPFKLLSAYKRHSSEETIRKIKEAKCDTIAKSIAVDNLELAQLLRDTNPYSKKNYNAMKIMR